MIADPKKKAGYGKHPAPAESQTPIKENNLMVTTVQNTPENVSPQNEGTSGPRGTKVACPTQVTWCSGHYPEDVEKYPEDAYAHDGYLGEESLGLRISADVEDALVFDFEWLWEIKLHDIDSEIADLRAAVDEIERRLRNFLTTRVTFKHYPDDEDTAGPGFYGVVVDGDERTGIDIVCDTTRNPRLWGLIVHAQPSETATTAYPVNVIQTALAAASAKARELNLADKH